MFSISSGPRGRSGNECTLANDIGHVLCSFCFWSSWPALALGWVGIALRFARSLPSPVYFLTQAIQSRGGLTAPFLGDKVLAFWNVRTSRHDHALRCVEAAQELMRATTELGLSVRVACTGGCGFVHSSPAFLPPFSLSLFLSLLW